MKRQVAPSPAPAAAPVTPPACIRVHAPRVVPPSKRRPFVKNAVLFVATLSLLGLLHTASTTIPLPPLPWLFASQTAASNAVSPARQLNLAAFALSNTTATPPATPTLARPNSLAARYRSLHPLACSRTFLPALMDALGSIKPPARSVRLVKRPDALLVHVHSLCGEPLSEKFISAARFLAPRFALLIVSVSHGPGAGRSDVRRDVAAVRAAVRKANVPVKRAKRADTDSGTALMRAAMHLLVHRGETAALGGLVCSGTVYYTEEMDEYVSNDAFRWLVRDARPATQEKPARFHWHFAAMGHVTPSCCRFTKFGAGDGGKVLCETANGFAKKGCWIASLGGNGMWGFERDVVERTECQVHTFDCTGDWEVPQALKERVKIHKLCVGAKMQKKENFVPWAEVVKIGGGAPPNVLKMDIEGFEFPVLKELAEEAALLPDQMAVEVHANKAVTAQIADLFGRLLDVGYRLVHRADNPFCEPCSEVTLVRKDVLPSMVHQD